MLDKRYYLDVLSDVGFFKRTSSHAFVLEKFFSVSGFGETSEMSWRSVIRWSYLNGRDRTRCPGGRRLRAGSASGVGENEWRVDSDELRTIVSWVTYVVLGMVIDSSVCIDEALYNE